MDGIERKYKMVGLKRENFNEEVMTELSWIMNVLDELVNITGIETYETVLIKYRVQMEEEQALNRFLKENFKKLETLSIEEIQEMISSDFFAVNEKPWRMDNEVLEKLIKHAQNRLSRSIE